LGIINASPQIEASIKEQLGDASALLRFLKSAGSALEFLNYDMPEIVIIDFSNKGPDLDYLLKQITTDPWLNTFAIVGLYDENVDNEEELLERLREINVVNIIEYANIKANLVKTLRIIEENRQIVLRRDVSEKLVEKIDGSFEIDNDPFAVSSYSNLIVICLFNNGYIDKKIKTSLFIAFNELIMNGIEHGNCKIPYDEKSVFLAKGGDISTLIAEKCKNPEVAKKRVYLEYAITPAKSQFKIRDEGDGFDWQNVKNPLDSKNIYELHGRGILMTKHFVNDMQYNEKGNEVTFVIQHRQDTERAVPVGFADEEVLDLEPGDIVFQENEESNFLYYISSGKFSVYHKKKKVAEITPADIFVGEMSFLLNNRRSAMVKADTNARLIKISKKTFISVIKEYPHYGIFLSKLLAQKVVKANTETADLKSTRI
jgi:hypothetical protein